MDDQNNNRTMFQGDWSCSSCNKEIKELPFEPRETGNLLCRDCHASRREAQGEKQMFEGDWKCSSCGGSISKLPFQPRETGNLMCRDCFIKSKQ